MESGEVTQAHGAAATVCLLFGFGVFPLLIASALISGSASSCSWLSTSLLLLAAASAQRHHLVAPAGARPKPKMLSCGGLEGGGVLLRSSKGK